MFWHKFHLSYAKLAQFLCLPGFLCLSPPSGCEPALLQLWWRWTQTYQTSALSEEKHRCFMFCMRITPVDCQRKVCGLINTIIMLTENMSCMAMIALWCIAISENGAEWLLWLRLCIEVQWMTTDEKKREGRRWSHKADMMFIFRLRIKWTQAQFTEPLSNVKRFSPSPPKVYFLALNLSPIHNIEHSISHTYILLLSYSGLSRVSPVDETLWAFAVVWMKLLYQHGSADQMLAVFYLL